MAMTNSEDAPLSVVAVSKALADWIGKLGMVWVEGQLSEVRLRPGSQIVFMRLRDVQSEASVSLVATSAMVGAMSPPLAEGAQVVVLASVEYWSKRGDLHLRARQLRAVGLGELLARLEQLRRLLDAEGVFAPERKRPLPFLPRRVGLICGRNSEAERDVTVNARRRWPAVEFAIREVPVQGAGAVSAVTAALAELDAQPEVDVIIITRGGGSVEDLLPFSNEALVRAAAAARTPIVSAIGHERDRPLLDDVADVRASTPTDAARRVVPDWSEEVARVTNARAAIRAALGARVAAEQRTVDQLRRTGALQAASERLNRETDAVLRLRVEGRRALADRLGTSQATVQALRGRLHALSPAATLERGYAIVTTASGTVATAPSDIAHGARFTVRLRDGAFTGQRLDATSEETP
ncbi:MAG: exodeoxyribonuclease large subunit [Actinomycetota bacterium]|nr:exodeoxyribonuclease large subunit [Actinomycetota bacterium]